MTHVVESVTVEIAAPAEFVWGVLVDFARYPEWNPYTIAVETTLEVGSPIDLTLPAFDGSGGTFVTREFLRVVDPPHHLRYDNQDQIRGVLGVRDQWIDEVDADRCTYRTADVVSGQYADLAIETTGDWMKAGFDSVATALKLRAEHLLATRTGP